VWSATAELAAEPLAASWQCVADTFDVIRSHQLAATASRWVFARLQVYALRRADGVCLVLWLDHAVEAEQLGRIERLLGEFRNVEIDG
jgi:hypothetical protein